MFRHSIARALATAAAVVALATACGGTTGNQSDTGSTSSAGTNQALEGAAKIAADAMVPSVQSTLEGAGFKSVKVTSEMDDGQAVVTASVSLDQLKSGCKLNYESKVTNPDVYFDEVITPQKPDGVEVKGTARDTMSPRSAFDYVLKNHPTCLVPNAKAPTK